MNACPRRVVISLLAFALSATVPARGQDGASMDLQLAEDFYLAEKAQAAKPLDDLRDKYVAAVKKYGDQLQAAGKLEGVLETRKAVEDAAAGVPPDGQSPDPQLAKLESVYLKQLPEVEKQVSQPLARADQNYLTSLEQLVLRLTKAEKLEDALSVQAKLEDCRLKFLIPGVWDTFRGPKAEGVTSMTMILRPNGQATTIGENLPGTWTYADKLLTVDWGKLGKQKWTLTTAPVIEGTQGGMAISMKRGQAAAVAPVASLPRPQGPAKEPVVQIVSATYGSGGKNADVTARVKAFVEKRATFSASPGDMGADPTPGWNKGLNVKFIKDGIPRELNRGEGGVVGPESLFGPQDPAELEAFLAGTNWKSDIVLTFNSNKTLTVTNKLGSFRWQVGDDKRKVILIWSEDEKIDCEFDGPWSSFQEKGGKKRVFKKTR